MAKLKNLKDLFVHELKDLYSAEKQLVRALPKLAKSASNQELRQALEDHLEQTEGHIERLDQIFAELDASPRGPKCEAMEGLVEEGKSLLEEDSDADPDVLDAGIIASAQKTEHYEIAGYGTVRTWAQRLGMKRAVDLLQKTLDEEGEADKKLTKIAERQVNAEAAT